MIRLLEERDAGLLELLCEDSPFGCRILSGIRAYGWCRPFLRVWSDGQALFSLQDDCMTLCGTPEDPQETAAFLHMAGAAVCTGKTEELQRLPFPTVKTGVIVKREAQGDFAPPQPLPLPPVRRLYAVLKKAESPRFPVPEFEPFYLDVNHRLRHQAAAAVCLSEEACALAGAVCEREMLLTAVAVSPEMRRRGLGSRCVQQLLHAYPGRTVWALRGENENQEFYARLGFATAGTWRQCRVLQTEEEKEQTDESSLF